MRALRALLLQPLALADPEPVLFVGDDEGEAVKPDVVRNDGVRPDQQFDPAVRQRGERLPPVSRPVRRPSAANRGERVW